MEAVHTLHQAHRDAVKMWTGHKSKVLGTAQGRLAAHKDHHEAHSMPADHPDKHSTVQEAKAKTTEADLAHREASAEAAHAEAAKAKAEAVAAQADCSHRKKITDAMPEGKEKQIAAASLQAQVAVLVAKKGWATSKQQMADQISQGLECARAKAAAEAMPDGPDRTLKVEQAEEAEEKADAKEAEVFASRFRTRARTDTSVQWAPAAVAGSDPPWSRSAARFSAGWWKRSTWC